MPTDAYTISDDDSYYGYGVTLVGPDDFECRLGEPEDRIWSRDGRDAVARLNAQHAEIARLREEVARLQRERDEYEEALSSACRSHLQALAERDALAVRVEELKAAEAVVACEAIDAYQAGTPAAAPRTVTREQVSSEWAEAWANRIARYEGEDVATDIVGRILADLGLQVEGQGKETP